MIDVWAIVAANESIGGPQKNQHRGRENLLSLINIVKNRVDHLLN
jgi:hypothetical protein